MGLVHLYNMQNLKYYYIWNKLFLIAFRHVYIAYPTRRGHWLVRTVQIHTTAMVGAAGAAGTAAAAELQATQWRGISHGGPEPAELQATQWRLRWRTGDVAQRRRWRTGAGGHRGSPQPESLTGGGAASARTRRGGVCAPLDWGKLPGRATRLLRLEWGEGRRTVTVGSGRRRWR